MKTIYPQRLKDRYKKIPRICPNCNDFLFEDNDSTIKICKKCKLKFSFDLDISFFSQDKWVIYWIEVLK